MSLLQIAQLGHPVIRHGAESVSKKELASRTIQQLIDDMVETMRDASGVGLAAPQVHAPKRIILIEVKGDNYRYPGQSEVPLTVVVNPVVVSHSDVVEEGWEGCLSIPDLRGRVPRWESIKVAGKDRDGHPMEFQANGFYARVIQHEVDHLDGIVFLDRMSDLSTLTHFREFQKYWDTGG